jgi:hypothetical protein
MSSNALFREPNMTYARRRRVWWKPIAAIALTVGAGIVLWRFVPVTRTFDAFEMHGGPVVLDRPTNPRVVLLTSHWETPRFTSTRYAVRKKSTLHWDLWAYDANDLSQKWVVRLASIRQGQRDLEAGVLGVSHGTAWVLADGLMAVSVKNGDVIGDAPLIESRNAVLKGLMPSTRRQMYFDNGLVLIAADGQRWRIDDETLVATRDTAVAKSSILGVPIARATGTDNALPLQLLSQYQAYKSRSYVVGDTWFGMMHPSEVALQQRDPHTQDFALGLRYRLWAAPLRDTVNRFRNPIRLPVDYAPRAASPEFLLGGLLTMAGEGGREGVVGIAKPTRFIVVHQDRIDASAMQTLTCIGLDGTVCWNAPLKVSLATGFARLTAGGPSQWALMVVGETAGDPRYRGMPSLTRVAINDGTITQMRFASIDLSALVGTLTPYHRR